MLHSFRAVLKGNWLEWQEEVNQWLHGNSSVQVLVTILDEEPLAKTQGRGQQMAAVLEKLAQAGAFEGIEPLMWQREVRHDRGLPGREE
ncbi:MAG: hypothetical protein DSM106950_16130 [Stigonema ocellatum SAG 48.90 = DSM 106950]|nr:hypothetical protein [Stigonema ocellatum SAG 48.90 = DSM 106950]